MTAERWLPVPGYEGLYEVSDAGGVRSLDRVVPMRNRGGMTTRTYRGKVKTKRFDKDGYSAIRLYKLGRGRHFRTSRLVLLAFARAPIGPEEACHVDHDKSNNSLRNLRWGTRLENEADKTVAGRRPQSTVGHLTADDARNIRQLYANGATRLELARRFNTHHTNVWLVTKGKTWAQA